jgi:hypothetical protein
MPWTVLSALLSRFPFPRHALLLMTFSSLVDFLYVLSRCNFLFLILDGLQFKPKTCVIQAHKGDKIKVHYRVKEICADLFHFSKLDCLFSKISKPSVPDDSSDFFFITNLWPV